MVKADVGDDAEVGTEEVGAIQSTSQAYFDNRYVYLLFGEMIECQGSSQFEEGWMKRLEESSMLFYEADNVLLRNDFSIDPDALTEIHEVGGGVQAYFVTCRLEDGC